MKCCASDDGAFVIALDETVSSGSVTIVLYFNSCSFMCEVTNQT